MLDHYELNSPDPQALQDVLDAHQLYDAPNTPVLLGTVMELSVFDVPTYDDE